MSEHNDSRWLEESGRCRRCAAEMDGEYCSACGQRHAARLRLRRILPEAFRDITSLERGLGRTTLELARSPGRMVRSYIGGDRSGYTNPAKYLLLMATLYALVINLFGIDVRPAGTQSDDPLAVVTMRRVVSILGYMMYLYLLPAAAVLRVCFRKAGLNFTECYVVLLYFAGQYLFYVTILSLAGAFSLSFGFWLVRAIGLVLMVWFLAGVFRASALRTVLASLAVYAAVVVGGALSGLIVSIAIWLIPFLRPNAG
jgi:hypothetical protein